VSLLLSSGEKQIKVQAMAHLHQTGALDTASWRAYIEMELGQTISIAKHCALLSVKQVRQQVLSLVHVNAP
jgi:hypothetical protein